MHTHTDLNKLVRAAYAELEILLQVGEPRQDARPFPIICMCSARCVRTPVACSLCACYPAYCTDSSSSRQSWSVSADRGDGQSRGAGGRQRKASRHLQCLAQLVIGRQGMGYCYRLHRKESLEDNFSYPR